MRNNRDRRQYGTPGTGTGEVTDSRLLPPNLEERLVEVLGDMPCDLSYDELTEEEPED